MTKLPPFCDLPSEVYLCFQAVEKATLFTQLIHQHYLSSPTLKQDASPVTLADLGSQAIIHFYLSKAFPNDIMIAEESGDSLQSIEESANALPSFQHSETFLSLISNLLKQKDLSLETVSKLIDWGRPSKSSPTSIGSPSHPPPSSYTTSNAISIGQWTLDPIDGTLGYLRQQQYAICLAKFHPVNLSAIYFSILSCPNLYQILSASNQPTNPMNLPTPTNQQSPAAFSSLHFALLGHGSFIIEKGLSDDYSDAAFKPIKTQSIQSSQDITFCFSVEPRHSSQAFQDKILQKLGSKNIPIKIDSQCKYVLVARGIASAYIRWPLNPLYLEKIWDHAPGFLLVKEAGGCVTDLNGKELDFSNGTFLSNNVGILASCNSIIHNIILDAIRDISLPE